MRVFNLFYVLFSLKLLFALGKYTRQCLKSSTYKSFIANLSYAQPDKTQERFCDKTQYFQV